MTRGLGLVLAAAVAWSSVPVTVANDEPSLDLGIRQVDEGDLSSAILTLEAVVQRLTADSAAPASALVQAYLYKGIALVGLAQEESAKAAFRAALGLDPHLRVRKGEQPDRVVRVFEAARQGKQKSVMQRPSSAPAKTGLGVGSGVAIVGGMVALGGVSIAASRSDLNPSPAPTPTPTPDVPAASAVGLPLTITLTNETPPLNATVSGCGPVVDSCATALEMLFTLESPVSVRNVRLRVRVESIDGSGSPRQCLFGCSSAFDLNGGEPHRTVVRGFKAQSDCAIFTHSCSTPMVITGMTVENMYGTRDSVFQQFFSLYYEFVR